MKEKEQLNVPAVASVASLRKTQWGSVAFDIIYMENCIFLSMDILALYISTQ